MLTIFYFLFILIYYYDSSNSYSDSNFKIGYHKVEFEIYI